MKRPRLPHIARAIAAVALVLSPKAAEAQACCAAGSDELGVVARCSRAVIASQLSLDHAFGSFDTRGNYRTLDGTVDDAVLTLGGGVRLFPRSLQLHGSVPLRVQRRNLSGLEDSTGAGLGDSTLSLRFTAVEDRMGAVSGDPASWVPFVDLYAGSRLPTGKPPEDSDEPSQSDVTGDGTWSPFVGAKLSKYFGEEHAFILQAQYVMRLERDVPGGPGGESVRFDAGDLVVLRVSYFQQHGLRWTFGPFVQLELGLKARRDGQTVEDSEMRRLRFGGHVAWLFDFPNWEVWANASSDAFWDGASENVPFAGPALGLGMSRHFH